MSIDYSEVLSEEKRLARQRHKRAGLTAVCKTNFSQDLPPDLDAAMQRIWNIGNIDGLKRDDACGRLYAKIAKGTASMSTADVVRYAQMTDDEMKKLAPKLADGKAL